MAGLSEWLAPSWNMSKGSRCRNTTSSIPLSPKRLLFENELCRRHRCDRLCFLLFIFKKDLIKCCVIRIRFLFWELVASSSCPQAPGSLQSLCPFRWSQTNLTAHLFSYLFILRTSYCRVKQRQVNESEYVSKLWGSSNFCPECSLCTSSPLQYYTVIILFM